MNAKKLIIPIVFTVLLTFSVVSKIFFNDFQDGWNAYKKKDYKTAHELWLPLAEQGEPRAQFFLGFMHEIGFGIPKNDKKALKWYQLAAKQGDPRAQLFTGFMYDFGQGVPEDDQKAVKWYQLASEQGVRHAKTYIYKLAKKNSHEALKILLNDAENGSDEAKINLAASRELEFNVSLDYRKVMSRDQVAEEEKYVQVGKRILTELRLALVDREMTTAQYKLGNMNAEGQEVRQGFNKELKWYKSAEYSAKINKYNLARENVPQALQELKGDAEKGVVEAQFILATMYANGRGVSRDNKEAFRLFYQLVKKKRAALEEIAVDKFKKMNIPQELKFLINDAESGLEDAQLKLGMLYAQGQDLPQDNEQAVKWYRLAAEQGNSEAQYILGMMYLKGLGVLSSEQEAMKWFRFYLGQTIIKLGQKNVQEKNSTYSLAKKNIEAAVEILKNDAENGTAKAQYSLAVLYNHGLGILTNYKKSYMWFSLAALQGYEDAEISRDAVVLKHSMSPQAVTESQKMTKEWKQSE
jgi:uncharacterized protein